MPDGVESAKVRCVSRNVLAGMLLGMFSTLCHGDTLSLLATEYPPYTSPSLPQQGIVTAITVEALRRSGHQVVIQYRPWARALYEVKEGSSDGVVGLWHSKERETFLAYTQPLVDNVVGFYARTDRRHDVRSLPRLRSLTIGVVRGYLKPPNVIAARLRTEEAIDDEANLRKLAAGHVDLALIDKGVASYLLRYRMPEQRTQLVWLEPRVYTLPLYVAFSRSVPGWERHVADFNAGLAAMHKDGTLERLQRELGSEPVPVGG